MFTSRTSQEASPSGRLPAMFQTEVAYRVKVLPAPTRSRIQLSAPLRGSISVGAQRPTAYGNQLNQGSQQQSTK